MSVSYSAHSLSVWQRKAKPENRWNRSMYAFWLCVAGTLLLPPLLKQAVLGGLGSFFNPLYIVASLLFLKPRKASETGVVEVVFLCAAAFLSIVALFSNLSAGYDSYTCLKAFLTLNLPLVMLVCWRSVCFKHDSMGLALKLFDGIIIGLFVWAVLNSLSGGALVKVFASFAQGLVDYKNIDRLWTPYGHPLYNAALFLAFFCFNSIASKRGSGVLPNWAVLIISATGLLLCASKSAFAIYLVLLLLWYTSDVKRGLLVVFLGTALFAFGGFDLIVDRLSQGLSSGRFETWGLMQDMGILRPFGIWEGDGISAAFRYDSQLAWASSAFEFPVLGYSLSYGIAYTVVLYIVMFLYPVTVLMRSRAWLELIAFLAMSAHMNIFNGLYLVADYFAAFVFYTVVLLQISQIRRSNKAVDPLRESRG